MKQQHARAYARPHARPNSGAFTMIELIVVVTLAGLIGTATVMKFQRLGETARRNSCVSQQQMIENAISSWCTRHVALSVNAGDQCAAYFDRRGFCDTFLVGSPPAPFANSWKILNEVKTAAPFLCPKVLTKFENLVERVPAGLFIFSPPQGCYYGNYLFYYNAPGTSAWGNGVTPFWNDPKSSTGSHQFVYCSAYGAYNCEFLVPEIKGFLHSNRWARF